VDVNILKEIARVVQSRAKVPERIQLQKRTFLITYLDDHRQRIEEALRRHDPDRLNMLFGQLESKVKYQVVRGTSRSTSPSKSTGSAASRAKARTGKPAKKSRPAVASAKQSTRQSKRPSSKRPTKSAKSQKAAARKTAPKRQSARKRVR
jgi:hypothetical protein